MNIIRNVSLGFKIEPLDIEEEEELSIEEVAERLSEEELEELEEEGFL